MIKFEVVELYKDKNINLPKRSTKYSAGYDIEAAEDVVIPSIFSHKNTCDKICTIDEIKKIAKNDNLRVLVPTGLKVQMENDMYLELHIRSSFGCCLLQLANQIGIIDSDYYNNPDNEGHIFIALINLSPYDIHIKKGEKIAQGIFKKYITVSEDSLGLETQSIRVGGFGSTDKNK